MEFDQTKAVEIIVKHNLSKKNISLWKTRKSIPDKYFKENYTPPTKDKTTSYIQRRTLLVLSNKKLQISTIANLSEIPRQKFHDVRRKSSNFSSQELKSIKQVIKKMRIEIKHVIEPLSNKTVFEQSDIDNIEQILRMPHIVRKLLIGSPEAKKIQDWLDGSRKIDNILLKFVIDKLSIFVLETNI